MKIAVFHNLPPGGAKRVVFEQIRRLSQSHKLYLFRLTSTDESFLDVRPYCEKVFSYQFKIESNLPSFLARLHRDFNNFITLNSIHTKMAEDINAGGYDVALVHTDMLTEAPFLLRYLSIPNVYFDQEMLAIVYSKKFEFREKVSTVKKVYELLTRKIRKEIDKKSAKSASVTLTNSKFMKKHIKKTYGKNSRVCYPGVDTKVFKKSGKKKMRALFIGKKEEGFDLIDKAMRIVNKKVRLSLEVLGNERGMLVTSDNKLAEKYSEATVTLCANPVEAFGLKAIESMACETPVLAVNEGGYKETVLDGKTGFLLKRNPKEFAKKIVYLIKQPEVVEKMGKAGREHVIKNFNWERHTQILEKELQKLAE